MQFFCKLTSITEKIWKDIVIIAKLIYIYYMFKRNIIKILTFLLLMQGITVSASRAGSSIDPYMISEHSTPHTPGLIKKNHRTAELQLPELLIAVQENLQILNILFSISNYYGLNKYFHNILYSNTDKYLILLFVLAKIDGKNNYIKKILKNNEFANTFNEMEEKKILCLETLESSHARNRIDILFEKVFIFIIFKSLKVKKFRLTLKNCEKYFKSKNINFENINSMKTWPELPDHLKERAKTIAANLPEGDLKEVIQFNINALESLENYHNRLEQIELLKTVELTDTKQKLDHLPKEKEKESLLELISADVASFLAGEELEEEDEKY